MGPYTLWVITEITTKAMEHLAWPIVLIIIVWWFKDQIKELIRKLKKGKWGSAEWEFTELATAAEIDSQHIDVDLPNEDIVEEVEGEIYSDPKGTILSAWLEVEKTLHEVVRAKNLELRDGRNPRTGATIKIKAASSSVSRYLRALQKSGLVSPEVISLIHDLRTMRNEVVHSFDFTPPNSAIYSYVTTANRVVEALRKLDQHN